MESTLVVSPFSRSCNKCVQNTPTSNFCVPCALSLTKVFPVQSGGSITVQWQQYLEVFRFDSQRCFYRKAENPNESNR